MIARLPNNCAASGRGCVRQSTVLLGKKTAFQLLCKFIPAIFNQKISRTMSEEKNDLLEMKNDLKDIFFAGLNSVKPHVLIQNKIKVSENTLFVEGKGYALGNRVYLVGFGKAVLGMAMEMEKLLGKKLTKGIVSLPRGCMNEQLKSMNNVPVFEPSGVINYRENCVNNQADDETLKTTRELMDLTRSLEEKDTLIVLVSGGSSALLSMPPPSITLKEKNEFWKKLQNCGADIKEVNIVRQKLSMVKGGKFIELAYPATVISLILSDIIGDPVDLIGGGPTCYVNREPCDVFKILNKYNIKTIDDKMKKVLNNNESRDKNHFTNVHNHVIGNNSCAISAARNEALKKGLNVIVLCNDIEGAVKNVSKMYVKLTKLFCGILTNAITKEEFTNCVSNCDGLKSLQERIDVIFSHLENNTDKGLVLIGAGEPSVVVTGTGKGGRNQELALQFSLDWAQEIEKTSAMKEFDALFLSAGTDGQDGPTDADGAFGYADIAKNERSKDHLANNDAYHFYSDFEQGGNLLKTGLSGTNVMDLHLIYIKKK
ncbi:glycerate kinase [Diachasmimorpha longicaudata]|uniref:glycerate kinase n=1 Tax=Diachasmimorpha longicaudata TaxID=58733 RepID=UPI0030B86EB9